MLRTGLAFLLVSLALAAAQNANPAFPLYGMLAIVPTPNPAIVDDTTTIDVVVQNTAVVGENASNVEVTLAYNDWGVTYQGWQEIGTKVVPLIAGQDSVTEQFSYVFENRAHTCLQATITSNDGGNAITTDDRTQINMEVVNEGEELNYPVPFGNGADVEVVVDGLEILCFKDGVEVQCFDIFGADVGGAGLEDEDGNPLDLAAPFALAPHETKTMNLHVAMIPDVEKFGVMVKAKMNGEMNQVLVQIVKTTVAEILNEPMLCCIESIKTRVLLETMLADALDAYDAGDCKAAIKLLRLFIQKAILLECDLTTSEKACIEKALLQVVDAARMIAKEHACEDSDVKPIIREGDFFRQAGLYEAALLEYSKACC